MLYKISYAYICMYILASAYIICYETIMMFFLDGTCTVLEGRRRSFADGRKLIVVILVVDALAEWKNVSRLD